MLIATLILSFLSLSQESHNTLGPPPAPVVNPITVVDEGSINTSTTFLVSWNESNCAVQYVVTINSSDDRVYPNITTSNTNTTVTLPTGVEFCVTLVAVDSIGRREPDTTPVCYQCEWFFIAIIIYFVIVFNLL